MFSDAEESLVSSNTGHFVFTVSVLVIAYLSLSSCLLSILSVAHYGVQKLLFYYARGGAPFSCI